MKTNNPLIASITTFAFAALVAIPAHAITVAGWDFSQYTGDGFLSLDGGATFVDTLSANYSNLDPTQNLGTESAQYGTMYINGDFGSTNVVEGSGTEEFLPSQLFGSLSSNINAPVQAFGDNPFDSHNELKFEGQQFAEFLTMTAASAASVVFKAALGTAVGDDWSLSFGGRTFSGTSTVTVDLSTDGTNFTNGIGSANLTTTDTPFNIALTSGDASNVFVRLNFNPAEGQPYIDNVAIQGTVSVPEASTAALLATGLVGLLAFRRRS